MAITLPTLPRQASLDFRMQDLGGDLTPIFGGPVQRILRLGSRLLADVTLPTLTAACARTWIAARLRAKTEGETLRLTVPQMGAAPADRAAISGAGAGLVVADGTGLAAGQLFSFEAGGVVYLHMVTGVAGGAVSVGPALRANPAGLTLNFAAPVIEGLVDGPDWSLERMRFVGQRFTLAEAR